jgi:hypothetical protein
MKHLLYSIFVTLSALLIISCEEQEDFGLAQSKKGFNLRLAPDKNSFDISAGDPEINFTIYSDNKDIDKVKIYVDLIKFGSDGPTPQALLTEIPGNTLGNSPSANVQMKLSEFVSAVGLTLDDLGGGDIFNIYNQVFLSDGRVYPDTLEFDGDEFANVENAFFTAAGTTSFTTTLTFPVLCPFVTEDAIGTYSITRDDFEAAWDPAYKPEVIAGPGPNQVTFVNMLSNPQGYDIIVDVDPVTDIATVKAQQGWHSGNYGAPFGEILVQGGGFYFSCTGFLTLDLAHNLADGRTYGTFRIEFTKE